MAVVRGAGCGSWRWLAGGPWRQCCRPPRHSRLAAWSGLTCGSTMRKAPSIVPTCGSLTRRGRGVSGCPPLTLLWARLTYGARWLPFPRLAYRRSSVVVPQSGCCSACSPSSFRSRGSPVAFLCFALPHPSASSYIHMSPSFSSLHHTSPSSPIPSSHIPFITTSHIPPSHHHTSLHHTSLLHHTSPSPHVPFIPSSHIPSSHIPSSHIPSALLSSHLLPSRPPLISPPSLSPSSHLTSFPLALLCPTLPLLAGIRARCATDDRQMPLRLLLGARVEGGGLGETSAGAF